MISTTPDFPIFVSAFERQGWIPLEAEYYMIDGNWVFLYLAKKGNHVVSNGVDEKFYVNGRKLTYSRFYAYFSTRISRVKINRMGKPVYQYLTKEFIKGICY